VNFHAASIEPGWKDEYVRTVQIGNHIFYRRPGHAHLSGGMSIQPSLKGRVASFRNSPAC